jgi:hypothetical protein
MKRWRFSPGSSARIAAVNTRARWTIGILVALVIGLAVGLIIVAGDDNDDNTTTTPIESVTSPTTAPTTTSQATTTSTPTQTNGGTPSPNPGDSTTPGGTGGL